MESKVTLVHEILISSSKPYLNYIGLRNINFGTLKLYILIFKILT